MSSSETNLPKKNIAGRIIFCFVSIIVAIILVIVLVSVVMTRSQTDVPVVMGYSMFSVKTEGGYVPKGDMVICEIKSGKNMGGGQNVVYKDGYDTLNYAIIKTGRIESTESTDGEGFFKVTLDDTARSTNDIIGEISFAVPKLGAIIDFVKTPLGLICCVAIPLFLLLIFEVFNLIKLSKAQKLEENEMESNLPSYMRISEGEGGGLEELPPESINIGTQKPIRKPVVIDEAVAAQELVSGLNNKIIFEQQDEELELVEPRGAFQNITYKKPEPVKEDAHADSIYSTREWRLPVEQGTVLNAAENVATEVIPQEEKREFSATIGADTKNHFNIEGIDVRVVSDAIKLSLDNDTSSRDISITVTNDYTNVVVETKSAEINFAMFKDDADKEQKVIIQKKVK